MSNKLRSLALALSAFVLVLAGCASVNPIAVAQTPDQKFAAVKLTYDAVLSVGVQIVQDQAAPIEVRRALQTAIAASGDAYRSANEAYVGYVAARAELTGADTTSGKVDVATRNLENWLTQLQSVTSKLAAITHR